METQTPAPIHPDHERFDHKKPHHWKRLILETFGIALCVGTAGLIFFLWDYDYRLGEEINMIEASIPEIPVVVQPTSTSTSTPTQATSTDSTSSPQAGSVIE